MLPGGPTKVPLELWEKPQSARDIGIWTIGRVWGPFQNPCLDSRKTIVALDGIIVVDLEVPVPGLSIPGTILIWFCLAIPGTTLVWLGRQIEVTLFENKDTDKMTLFSHILSGFCSVFSVLQNEFN